MPLPEKDEKVLVHAFVHLREAGNQPNSKNPSFYVVICLVILLAAINLVNIVMGEVYTHFFVQHVYTT